jgi:hypothetical protein
MTFVEEGNNRREVTRLPELWASEMGLGAKNDCAGEDQQKFPRKKDNQRWSKRSACTEGSTPSPFE